MGHRFWVPLQSVVFAWPGRTGRPPHGVCRATPLCWLGRTSPPPERVRCATPCFCFAAVVASAACFPLLALRSLMSVRLLAVRWCLLRPAAAPPAPQPHLTPPHPSACCLLPPPLLLGVAPPAGCCFRPPPVGLRFAAVGVLLRVFPCSLCALWFLCAAWLFVGASCCPPPPPPPGLCFADVVALPLVFLCSPSTFSWFRAGLPFVPPSPSPRVVFRGCRCPVARFPVSSCCFLFFSVPLALAPVWLGLFFPPRLASFRALCALCAGAPPPPGCCSW